MLNLLLFLCCARDIVGVNQFKVTVVNSSIYDPWLQKNKNKRNDVARTNQSPYVAYIYLARTARTNEHTLPVIECTHRPDTCMHAYASSSYAIAHAYASSLRVRTRRSTTARAHHSACSALHASTDDSRSVFCCGLIVIMIISHEHMHIYTLTLSRPYLDVHGSTLIHMC